MVRALCLTMALTWAALFLAACGSGVGLPTGSTSVERGESGAINPARNVSVVCEDKTRNTNAGVTVNITNNCTKDNTEGVPAEEGEE